MLHLSSHSRLLISCPAFGGFPVWTLKLSERKKTWSEQRLTCMLKKINKTLTLIKSIMSTSSTYKVVWKQLFLGQLTQSIKMEPTDKLNLLKVNVSLSMRARKRWDLELKPASDVIKTNYSAALFCIACSAFSSSYENQTQNWATRGDRGKEVQFQDFFVASCEGFWKSRCQKLHTDFGNWNRNF